MKIYRFRHTVLITIFIITLALGMAGCTWLSPEEPPPEAESQEVVGVTEIGGVSTVELGDGRTFPLDSLDDWEEYEGRFPPPQGTMAAPKTTEPRSLPETVDLRSYQTSIKSQWGGTCVQFAITAAIEARYRRIYTGSLDLSERFGQLVQKMAYLSEDLEPQASCRENQLGGWGGGNLSYQMQLFTRYRLPLESHLPYSTIVDPGIDWRASHCTAGTNQEAIDDYNLASTNLPQLALENARFRAETIHFCPSGSLRDPSWYEEVLANGYEVLFSVRLCGADPTPGNGVWDPGSGGDCGGHAMLMVGYRHSDRVFLVKNSWGYNAEHDEDGFTRMGYDWVEDGYVVEAGYITAVAADSAYPFNDHMLLGRWNLNHDGWKGTLDIYRFPDLFEASALHGEDDLRIGTYWGHGGVARRVNGTIDDYTIEFWIDWGTPNLGYGNLQGLHFTGYLFTQDPDAIAGTMVDNRDGQTYGFYGTKDAFLTSTGAPGTLNPESFLGRWSMNHDGWRGILEFTDLQLPVMVILPSPAIYGTYTPEGGSPLPVSGHLNPENSREIWFEIPFGEGEPQPFHGYLHSHETGIMCGTTEWNGVPFGFVANRLEGLE